MTREPPKRSASQPPTGRINEPRSGPIQVTEAAATLDESNQIRLQDGPAGTWSGISADVLLAYGANGPSYYAGLNESLARALPRARVLPIPGSGHDGLNRAPDRLVEPLVEFFAGLRL